MDQPTGRPNDHPRRMEPITVMRQTGPGRQLRMLRRLVALFILLALAWMRPALATEGEGDITMNGRYLIDETGQMFVEQAAGEPAKLRPMERRHDFDLGRSALWIRFDLPPLDPSHRWYLLLSGGAFIDHASLFTQGPGGRWSEQRAGDHLPVSKWSLPNATPLFEVPTNAAGTVWLRLQNKPAPTSAYVRLVTDTSLQLDRQWNYLLVGG